jgi:hypothetical protein
VGGSEPHAAERIGRADSSVLENESGIDHALASRKLYTDGASILYDDAKAQNEDEVLTVVVSGQGVFHEVIRSYLDRSRRRTERACCTAISTANHCSSRSSPTG